MTDTTARLGIVISMFPELHETFILRELVALERRGVDFDIYSLQFPRDPITIDDAIRLTRERSHYAPLLGLRCWTALARTLLRHPLRTLSSIVELAWQGRDRPREVAKNLAILPLAMHVGERGRARGITHWHGHWANIPTTACWYLHKIHDAHFSAAIHGEDIFTRNRFLATKLDAASFTVVCSGLFRDHLKNALGLARPEKVHLNYHGLDPRILERASERTDATAHPEPGAPLKLVSIGRLVPTKGHDTVFRAVKLLAESGQAVQLDLIGSGPDDATLRALATALGVDAHVNFRGGLAFDEVIDTLIAADVFCLAPRLLPGHPPDGIPNVIAEAMALGVPVATTRVSAIPELVEDGESGLLVEVDDAAALADAMARLARDSALYSRISMGARQRVAGLFDQDANIDELIEHFQHYVPDTAIALGSPPPRDAADAPSRGPGALLSSGDAA